MAALVALLAHIVRSALRRVFPSSRLTFLVDRTPYGLPVPVNPHQTVDLEANSLVVVGDVHGCYDEMAELLERCGCGRPGVTTVFVGDLINKGPKSAEVVKRARAMGAWSVRGNHEEVCLRSWQSYVEGREPLPTKFQWMHQLDGEDLQWLFDLPFSLTIPSVGAIVVHAGLVPGVPLSEQSQFAMLHIRDVSRRGDAAAGSPEWMWHKKAAEGTVPWAGEWNGPEHVYFGHDAIRRLQQYPHATGLDTGCVYGGKLTAVLPLEAGKIVQVDAHAVHQDPGKKPQGQQKGS